MPGSVSIDEQYNNMYVSVSENGSTLDISFSQNLGSGQTVFRIVGIRSGGGSVLADLLAAALEGVA